MKTILLALIVLSLPLWAQKEQSREMMTQGYQPDFFYDAYNFKSTEPGRTRVDFFVEVPYEIIQFVKSGSSFTASYMVTISFYDEKKEKLMTEKSWSETVSTTNFDETTSKHNYYLSARSFDLEPREYFVRCEIEDKDSKKNIVREDKFTVRDLNTPVAISDIMLIDRQVVVNGNSKFIPNISRNVAEQKEGLKFFYEIYSDTSKSINVEYEISDRKDNNIYKENESKTLVKGSNPVNNTLKNKELSMGQYRLAVHLKSDDGKDLTEASKGFYSRWVGLPSTVNDIDKAVEQMVYIAKGDELDHIKKASSQEEKMSRFIDYWKKKDPTPNTESNEVFNEYYRRISFSNEHFKHYQEGWRTDMGMVYVTLGPPSNIERHPFEYDSKPFEVWDYYDINKRFIFVDQTGFGDYRLLDPVYGSWWKYRQ